MGHAATLTGGMDPVKELPYAECLRLLNQHDVGRVAVCAPDGPQIVPVNYVVDAESIVFRTAPYSVLGSHADGARLAFEVDSLQEADQTAWSVVALGTGHLIEDPFELARLREHGGPQPWAGGARPMHVRLTWHHLSGRRVGRNREAGQPGQPVG